MAALFGLLHRYGSFVLTGRFTLIVIRLSSVIRWRVAWGRKSSQIGLRRLALASGAIFKLFPAHQASRILALAS